MVHTVGNEGLSVGHRRGCDLLKKARCWNPGEREKDRRDVV